MEEDQEMARVREIFERALNAIVSATQLAKEVTELRGSVDSLRSEIESVRSYNQRLDVELTATREQRDQALRDKQAAIDSLNQATSESNRLNSLLQSHLTEHEQLSEQHENLKREHDNVQLSNMQLEEEVTQLKAKLEKVKAVFGIQPRDVTTGQFDSPREVLQEPSHEQVDQPKTGTDPYWR